MDNNRVPDLKNNYDRNRSKPSHERAVDDPMYQSATKSALSQEAERIRQRDKTGQKNLGNRFIDLPVFVPLDPIESLEGTESKITTKATYVIIGFITAWLIVSFATIKGVMKLLNAGMIAAILFDIVIGLFLLYFIMSKYIFNVDGKRRLMAMQSGNKHMNLGQIWGINPGGITETKMKSKPSTTVYYTGIETIVLKVLKKSVLVSGDTADWHHYESLQRLEDVIIKNRYKFTKINTKFSPENDEIWDDLNKNLEGSSRLLGKEYTDLMAEILDYQYKYTSNNSTVSATYYLIQPAFVSAPKPFSQLVPELMHLLSDARCTLATVSNKEYVRLIRDYYGVSYLDIESITNYLSANTDSPVIEVKLVQFVNDKGELIKLKDYYVPQLPTYYKSSEHVKRERDIIREKDKELQDELSVFGDKVIRQRQS